ncbi:MAG TPA: putative zinc-binding protein [Nitrospiria bacterium]
MAPTKEPSSPAFSLQVDGIEGSCPAGEKWATEKRLNKRIPVIACEGPCVRGDIARNAANRVAEEKPYARCCYQEVLGVPHSAMARWVRESRKVVMIDGCFLSCVGRILKHRVNGGKMIHIDALPLYRKYTDFFSLASVPEEKRKATGRQVGEKILSILEKNGIKAA